MCEDRIGVLGRHFLSFPVMAGAQCSGSPLWDPLSESRHPRTRLVALHHVLVRSLVLLYSCPFL